MLPRRFQPIKVRIYICINLFLSFRFKLNEECLFCQSDSTWKKLDIFIPPRLYFQFQVQIERKCYYYDWELYGPALSHSKVNLFPLFPSFPMFYRKLWWKNCIKKFWVALKAHFENILSTIFLRHLAEELYIHSANFSTMSLAYDKFATFASLNCRHKLCLCLTRAKEYIIFNF